YGRYQPHDFPPWDGWINTDSMIFESDHDERWFQRIAAPEASCIVVYGSHTSGGHRLPGHVGLVVDPTAGAPRLVHCSHGNDRTFGYAIAETDDAAWRDPGKKARYLRYMRNG